MNAFAWLFRQKPRTIKCPGLYIVGRVPRGQHNVVWGDRVFPANSRKHAKRIAREAFGTRGRACYVGPIPARVLKDMRKDTP